MSKVITDISMYFKKGLTYKKMCKVFILKNALRILIFKLNIFPVLVDTKKGTLVIFIHNYLELLYCNDIKSDLYCLNSAA